MRKPQKTTPEPRKDLMDYDITDLVAIDFYYFILYACVAASLLLLLTHVVK